MKRLYMRVLRIDRISNPGVMPHIAPWKSIQKRLEKLKTRLIKSERLKPEITLDNSSKKILTIENKFSEIPQVIKFKCLENGYTSKDYFLLKNNPLNFLNSKINECELQKISYSVNNFKNSFLIKDSYVTNFNLKKSNYLDKSNKNKNKVDFKNKLIFDKKNYFIEKNKQITIRIYFLVLEQKICLQDNSILYIKNSNVFSLKAQKCQFL